LRLLGWGYYGRVFLAEKKNDGRLYAIKVIKKLDIIKWNFIDNLKNEKKIMFENDNPFVVNLEYCFTNPSMIFFAMKFKQGGELYHHLRA
jgi:serum/glucocorticoid-regulated kinase 2